MPRVRDAIRDALSAGDRLFTPNRKPFLVVALGVDEMSLQVGTHSARPIRIAFDALDAIPADMFRYGDEVPVDTVEGDAARGALEQFLLDRHGDGMMRAPYAAPVLVEAGVCLYLPRRAGEEQRIGLRPKWRLWG